MGREPRAWEPGGIYHVTAHGVDDRPIFYDDLDRQDFVLRLGRVGRRLRWRFYGICLLGTHFHLLVRLSEPDLGAGMAVVNGGHAREVNERHDRRGALFRSRYDGKLIVDDSHLLAAIRYVARNPVEAGIVARPEDWVWSTYGQLVGMRPAWPCFEPAVVLAHFARRQEDAVRIVRDFVTVSDTLKVSDTT